MDLCAKEDLQVPGLDDVELKFADMGEFDTMEDLRASSPGSPGGLNHPAGQSKQERD